MFLGEHEYRLDQKGRVTIPARFREALKEGFVLCRGLERCINVYHLSEWNRLSERQLDLPANREKTRRINRFTFSSAFPGEMDNLGRVVLPGALREYAQIKDEVTIAGIGRHIEIWDKGFWLAEKKRMEEQAWHIAEGLEER
ncbi:MAG: division/cell wall cluster transcriptional repressor MraZ [Chloroflexi bacterium]|nr:division/cell wall cluster transcriptional repressor MraZ [Chloroflexota bacterium]